MYEGKFKLEIELGNSKMCKLEHIAEALEHVKTLLLRSNAIDTHKIRDLNGNSVGKFWIEFD